MKKVSFVLLLGCIFSFSGCSSIYDTSCVDGVTYLHFTEGVSVKYNQDGTVSKCH